jgi:hypothetical protein
MHTYVHWRTQVPPHSYLNNFYRILRHTSWMANAKKQICNHHSVAPELIFLKILWFLLKVINYIHVLKNDSAVNIMRSQQRCKWRWQNYRITTLWKVLCLEMSTAFLCWAVCFKVLNIKIFWEQVIPAFYNTYIYRQSFLILNYLKNKYSQFTNGYFHAVCFIFCLKVEIQY